MKFKILIASLAMVLLTFASAYAFESSYLPKGSVLPLDSAVSNTPSVHGSISLTPAYIGVTGNKAQFSTYRDLDSGGLFSNFNIGYDNNIYWLDFKATNPGYKDQYDRVYGGMYDTFKFGVYLDQIIHNFTFGARSPYAGVGTQNLTSGTGTWSSTTMPTNPSQWPSTFDYSTQRTRVGGNFDVNLLDNISLDFSMMNEHKTGIYPLGGGSASAGQIELPVPIDWWTQDYNTSLLYQARPLFAQAGFDYSNFNDHDQYVNFEFPTALGRGGVAGGSDFNSDTLSMPTDNDYYKLFFKGSLELPYYSHLNVNIAKDRYESSQDLSPFFSNGGVSNIYQGLVLASTDSHYAADPSSLTFNGKRDVTNIDVTLTSNPIEWLDGRLFYKYYDSTNNSDDLIVQTPGANVAQVTPMVFDYKTSTYGVDLGWALPMEFHLDTQYNLVHTERPNPAFALPSTNDNTYYAELRWDGLDWITPRVSFRDFNRNGRGITTAAAGEGDSEFGPDLTQILEWFNIAAQHSKTYRAEIDTNPTNNFEFDVAYQYNTTFYPDSQVGLHSSRTNEWDVNSSYKVGQVVRFDGYFDLDNIKTDQTADQPGETAPGALNLTANNNYIMDQSVKDYEYEWGLGSTVFVIPDKLTFNIRYDYMNSDGRNDYTIINNSGLSLNELALRGPGVGLPAGANNDNIDPQYATYKDNAVSAKLTYNFTPGLALSGGAEFDHFEYNNINVDNYQYVYYSGTTPYFLSGAYSSPSYNANIEYVNLTYNF